MPGGERCRIGFEGLPHIVRKMMDDTTWDEIFLSHSDPDLRPLDS